MAQLMSIKRNVEMCPGQVSVPAIYHVSQGDKGTRIILGLVNNSANYTIPDGTTATIRGHRADGTLFTEITADVETTEVKFNLTEDMSAVPGRAECEAVLASGSANVIGTANFIIDVEKSPASIGSVFPGTDAAETWLIDELTNLDISGLDDESVVDAINNKASESTIAPEFDPSGSYTAGQYVYKNGVLYRFTAAHSGAWTGTDVEEVTVGGELNRLDNGSGSGLTEDVKVALLACFEKVAWIDEDGQDYYDALYDALYPPAPPATLTSITCVYTQSGTVYDSDTLDSLKSDLVVTAHYDNGTTQTVTAYTLSGTLTEGTSTITVSYGGKTTTFTVTVSSDNRFPLTYQGNFTNATPSSTRVTLGLEDMTLEYGQTLTVNVESGYVLFPIDEYGAGNDESLIRTAKAGGQIYVYGANASSGYVYGTSIMVCGTSSISKVRTSTNWDRTKDYAIQDSSVAAVTFSGVALFIEKGTTSSHGSEDITIDEAKNAISWSIA